MHKDLFGKAVNQMAMMSWHLSAPLVVPIFFIGTSVSISSCKPHAAFVAIVQEVGLVILLAVTDTYASGYTYQHAINTYSPHIKFSNNVVFG